MSPLLDDLQNRLGYRFRDPALLARALKHRSLGPDNNERLEFLGDAVLGLHVAESLLTRFDDIDEGQLSRMRSQVVKRDTLARVARQLELGAHIQMGSGESRSGGRRRDSILANACEAVIAAVYLDGGLDRARDLIDRAFAEALAGLDPSTSLKDPKTRLQEHLQAAQKPLPEYRIARIDGAAHDQVFTVHCVIDVLGLSAQGQGGSRKKAEQQAASAMLALLGQTKS